MGDKDKTNNPLYSFFNSLIKPWGSGDNAQNALTFGLNTIDKLWIQPGQFEDQFDFSKDYFNWTKNQAKSSWLDAQQAYNNQMGIYRNITDGWGNQNLTNAVDKTWQAGIDLGNRSGELMGLGSNSLSAYSDLMKQPTNKGLV